MRDPINDILEFQGVCIDYPLREYTLRAVSDATIGIKRGKITALVGESGSGKTTLASSVMHCISSPGRVAEGKIYFSDRSGEIIDVTALSEKQTRSFVWEKASMVFQAAQSALNPIMTVEQSFIETYKEHFPKADKKEIVEKTRKLLGYVRLDEDRCLKAYPHELSGGMKQRIMIAFSLLFDPQLIIFDEPTTALDVITQDYIFRLLKKINRETGISMLLLTHDISVVAKFADYVCVMYSGLVMEYGDKYAILGEKKHPYTCGLVGAIPSLNGDLSGMRPIEGSPPDLNNLPEGCVFSPRCDRCEKRCFEKRPGLYALEDRQIRCFKYEEGGRL